MSENLELLLYLCITAVQAFNDQISMQYGSDARPSSSAFIVHVHETGWFQVRSGISVD